MSAVPDFASKARTWGMGAAALVTATVMSGCSDGGSEAVPIDSAPIVIGDSSRPSPPPATEEVIPAFDPRAELDIEDQVGDGRSVVIDSVRVTRDNVYLVILDERGAILGTKALLPGVQPVKMELQRSVDSSGYLFGLLVIDNGDERIDPKTDIPLLDDDGEIVEEDFEYYLR